MRRPIPVPTSRRPVAFNRRFQLGVTINDVHFTYDFDQDARTIMIRFLDAGKLDLPHAHHGSELDAMMRYEQGEWLLMCQFDDSGEPTDVDLDLDEHHNQDVVLPMLAEAIAVFYDSDELPSPLHRKTLRAFYGKVADRRAVRVAELARNA
jgi:hypothetical protein